MQLPYEPDDDIAAEKCLGVELRAPDITRWRAMTTDAYVIQTHRVLKAIRRTISHTFAHRNAEVRQARADFRARLISDRQRREAVKRYEQWKCTALVFDSRVEMRLRQIVHRVRQLTGDNAFDAVQSALLVLGTAVADHQAIVEREGAASAADLLLWARLHELSFPQKHHEDTDRMVLAEAVRQAHTPVPAQG